jgi:hypothetical protein
MQLKKQLTIRKGLAAGTMTALMFASSLPALASDGGEGHGLGLGLGLKLGVEARADVDKELKAELREIEKEIRKDLRVKGEFRAEASASATAKADLRRCKSDASEAYRATVRTAHEERDRSMRKAQQDYLAALKKARDDYHAAVRASASVTVSASGSPTVSASGTTEASLRLEARKNYRDAVKAAQKAFAEAKRQIRTSTSAKIRAAQDTQRAAVAACKNAS